MKPGCHLPCKLFFELHVGILFGHITNLFIFAFFGTLNRSELVMVLTFASFNYQILRCSLVVTDENDNGILYAISKEGVKMSEK